MLCCWSKDRDQPKYRDQGSGISPKYRDQGSGIRDQPKDRDSGLVDEGGLAMPALAFGGFWGAYASVFCAGLRRWGLSLGLGGMG